MARHLPEEPPLKTILNKTRKPLRIQLHGGKTLHLGPGKTGQIADDAADEPTIKRLVKAKEIEIQGEGPSATGGDAQGSVMQEAPRGHHPKTVVLPKGNR
jgi:hypothetical protein